ncbi:hypothetical protein CJ030_MR8G027628 [Morella rubra]|uniref:Uncharacterized protein n=1 Tax=Morella rubra TaxID=262757 RepID=A0A6A1UUP5_9ROSI|nr:hypothetical protein CJ030_MR8G027628 [Morella rubra]
MKELEQAQALVTEAGLYSHPACLANLIDFSAMWSFGSLAPAQAMFKETTARARASRCVEEGGEGDGYGVASKGAEVPGRVLKLGFDCEGGFVGVAHQVFNEMTKKETYRS